MRHLNRRILSNPQLRNHILNYKSPVAETLETAVVNARLAEMVNDTVESQADKMEKRNKKLKNEITK